MLGEEEDKMWLILCMAMWMNSPLPNLKAHGLVFGLSIDQVERLLNLIDNPKMGCDKLSDNSDWLLGSGVTCHMIGDLNKLSKAHDIHPILVNMPNW